MSTGAADPRGRAELDRPEGRVEAVQVSIRCLTYGALSLIPLVGVVFGIKALGKALEVRVLRGGLWNPGARCVQGGLALASLGLFLFLVVVVIVGVQVARSMGV